MFISHTGTTWYDGILLIFVPAYPIMFNHCGNSTCLIELLHDETITINYPLFPFMSLVYGTWSGLRL